MLTDDYRVQLEAFEGPLDLLLYLIRKSEVEVTDIPVAAITEQYLGFLKGIERIDIEVAGEFLVMAATLMEIKSRMLMPRPADAPRENLAELSPAEDPRMDLVRQLLAYKQYRDAASALEERADEWAHRYPSGRAGVDDERLKAAMDEMGDVELEDLELIDLAAAFQRIAESVNFDRLGDHQVKYDDTPIEIHAADIVDLISRESAEPMHPDRGGMEFAKVFEGRTRGEMVGLFVALLDLVRRQRVAVRQDLRDAKIYVGLREAADSAAPAEVL